MRTIAAILILLMLPSELGSQTLLGHCTTDVTVQLSTGNVYCATAPSGCMGTGFDFTLSCNSQYLAVF